MPDPIPRGIDVDNYNVRQLREQFPIEGPRSYELVYLPETTSTMDVARSFGLRRGVVLTDHQTQGRGRVGRNWYDTPGKSVLMTVSEPFDHTEGDPQPLSHLPNQLFALACSVALRKVAQTRRVQICWPNDLVVHDGKNKKKLGGVLIENPDFSPDKTYPKLFGVGINVSYQDQTQVEDNLVVSLGEIANKQISRAQVTAALLTVGTLLELI